MTTIDATIKQGSMAEVMRYFNMKPGEFRVEWAKLTDDDKAQLKGGIADGTMTY